MKKLFVCCALLSALTNAAVADVAEHFKQIKSDPNALYAFLKEMPKGGELHYHLSGGAYPETMLAVAAKGKYCLNQDTFVISPLLQSCEGINASELSLNPAIYNQTIRAWSYKDFIPGQESAHDHFFSSFYLFGALAAAETVPLLAEVMQRAADQNEQYMEIMVMLDNGKSASIAPVPVASNNFDELRQSLLANKDFVAEINNTVQKADALLPDTRKFLNCDKQPEAKVCQLSVRFQYYVLRNQPFEKVFPQALHAFEAASKSPALVGVNLVQEEDGIISLRDYQQQMRLFQYMHEKYPNVHIALHAGELAPEAVLPENLRFHIHDAIKIGQAERIGHGVDIAFEDDAEALLGYMASHLIPVEINLVSNEKILNISGSEHPLSLYLSHHVPVMLSTDDEGILRTDLTRQYVNAVMKHAVDYPALKQINRNALTYSFLPGSSLWADAAGAKVVSACKELNSKTCEQFVATSEKAQLQKSLELKLRQFENKYN